MRNKNTITILGGTICILLLFAQLFTEPNIVEGQYTSGGLCGEYANYTGTPVYNPANVLVTQVDPTIDFSRGTSGPGSPINNDDFLIRWTGKIVPGESGNHTFRTYTDDGIRLYIDGVLIINNRTDHGPTYNYSAAQSLVAGQSYDILVEFYENGGGALMELDRLTPSAGSYATVPSSVLETDKVACTCGNGTVETREECDDGNVIDGDSCSSSCQIEYCRDDAPLNITDTIFDMAILNAGTVAGSSSYPDVQVALCYQESDGTKNIYYTTTDASGNYSFTNPDRGSYIPDWVNIGVMLHDSAGMDIDHHALTLWK